MRAGRRAAAGAAIFTVVALFGGAVAAAPHARLTSEAQLDPVYNQGIARANDGWVLSGTRVLARVDDRLQDTNRVTDAIPADWAARGFDHIGDVDIVGRYVYARYEQPDYERGEQAIARYDAEPLGSAGHVDGEGEGIDATKLRTGRLHVLTIDVMFTPVWMGNLTVSG